MDEWAPLFMALGPVLGKEVAVKPLVGPAAERFKA